MAHKHSYEITVKNNQTEREGLEFLTKTNKCFVIPPFHIKKEILANLGIASTFNRCFDLLLLKKPVKEGAKLIFNVDDVTLIELKTTKKKLSNNPKGFFFGATKNELDVAKKLGNKYKFCFVSLHKDSKSYKLLSYDQLKHLIKNKRIQYQINLKK